MKGCTSHVESMSGRKHTKYVENAHDNSNEWLLVQWPKRRMAEVSCPTTLFEPSVAESPRARAPYGLKVGLMSVVAMFSLWTTFLYQ